MRRPKGNVKDQKKKKKPQQQKQAKFLRSILKVNPESGCELESVCVHTYPRLLKYHRMYMDIEQSMELIFLLILNKSVQKLNSAITHCYQSVNCCNKIGN